MKGFKRKLAGFLVFAMVLGLFAPGMTTTVKAADSVNSQITIGVDLEEEKMKVGLNNNSYEDFTVEYVELKNFDITATTSGKALSVSEESLNIKESDWEEITVSKSNGYDGYVDLSWINKTKDTALLIKVSPITGKASSSAAIEYRVVKFHAQDKNVKVGFTKELPSVSGTALTPAKNVTIQNVTPAGVEGDPDLGYFYFYTKDGTGYELIYPNQVVWKKGASGKYTNVVNYLGKQMQVIKTKGATLYFQKQGASDPQGLYGSIATDHYNYDYTWPSKEVKYSFKKQAAAPKVTVDPLKTVIKLKKGQEYQILNKGVSVSSGAWIDVKLHNKTVNGKDKLPTLTIFNLFSGETTGGAIDTTKYLSREDIYSGDITIVVRTAATTKAIPSKQIKLKLDSFAATSTAIKWAFKGATTPEAITVGYKTPTNPASGIEVKNENPTTDYEIAYVVSGGSVDGSTKWIKVKKAKDATKPTVAKLTVAKGVTISTSGSILIRQVGEKANKSKGTDAKLAGDWTEMKLAGLVPLQKTVTMKVTDNKGVTVGAISNGAVTIKVAKSAVSGAAVKGITLEFTYENLGTSPKCSVDKKADGSVAFTLGTFDKTNSKVTLTIDVNSDETATPKSGSTTLTCDGVETTVNVVIE